MKEAPIKHAPLFLKPQLQPVAKKLNRGLELKHLTMISIGGSIGTGLFLASGSSIQAAGPGGALMAYSLIGLMVYLLMTSLGEMAAHMPVTGSFSTYSSRFIDPAFGFAVGWNYWFSWAITLAVEISAGSILMKFWFPDSSAVLWSVLFMAFMFGINILSVSKYGEAEYWFSMIKVVAVVFFIVVGIGTILGIFGGKTIGFENFTIGEAPINGGFFSILGIFMIAGFSFQGTELIGIVAGESKDPRKHVPKAIRQIFWRILLFYVLTIAVIGLAIPYTSPKLLGGSIEDVAMSPFTLLFERAGISFAASVMNAVILTSVLSAGNSGMYAATRMLWTMAKEGKAPAFLTKMNKNGIPVYALCLTAGVGMLAYAFSLIGKGSAFMWLLNASGLCGFLAWLSIAWSHYRFRKAYVRQGYDLNKLPYQAKWYPLGPIFTCLLCLFIILGQNYQAFMSNEIDWYSITVSYIGLPLFIMLWVVYKWANKTKFISIDQMKVGR